MRYSLQQILDHFVTDRELVKKQFWGESSEIYAICANIFCARNAWADMGVLSNCKRLLKEKTGIFSNFRGNLTAPIVSMLAAGTYPEGKMDLAMDNYAALKEEFWGSEYLALVAFLLADIDINARTAGVVSRGKAIYKRMKQEHPFLTSSEDSIFAVFMALSEKTDDALIQEMEIGYHTLKTRFYDSDAVQTASHVLALVPGDPTAKAERVIELYDAIRNAGKKYGRGYELSTLAALSIVEGNVADFVSDLMDADAFLALQKGYGFFGMSKKTRMMHAAMLVTDERLLQQYFASEAQTALTEAQKTAIQNASLTSTIAMLAAQQAAMCAAICAASASSAAATSSH